MKAAFPFLLLLCFGVVPNTEAATFQEARVSEVIQDVRLLASKAAARQAVVNDKIGEGTAVRTGAQSRAELTFADLTITRLGENTVFSLNQAAREIHLDHGSVLLEVPPKGAAARVTSAAVTAAVQGGTAIFGTGPPTKFLVLEGVGTFYPNAHPEEMVTLHGGEMVTLTPGGHVTTPQKFDVKTVLGSSALIVDFPALANLPLILAVVDQQQTDQSLTANASPPPSKDIIDVISVNTTANPAVIPSSTPAGTPSEFGSPPTITRPDPYVISSGTTIQTDPTITTNRVINFGTFYRGTALDGTPTEFLFGEPETAFDQLVFNGSQNHLPIAVFKFADLELTGNPTIIVPSGGATNLALVAVGTITSGGPGGTLTFTGTPRVSFITQDGSITLGPEISFSGIDHLEFYARGPDSSLTLTSPISGGSVVRLFSEGSLHVDTSISATNEFKSVSMGNFLQDGGVISASNLITIDQSDPAGPSTPTITIDGATLTSDTVNIAGAGDINIGLNNPVTINSNELELSILNELDAGVPATHGGTIAGDSTINFNGPNLSTGGLSVFLLNENDQGGAGTAGGHIDGSASITMNINGALNVNGSPSSSGLEPGAANFSVQNYGFGDGSPGGFIGSDASIILAAGRISTAADFNVFILNDTGGMIGGAARVAVTAGSLTADEFSAFISNTSFNVFNGNPSTVAGHITGAASISFNITGAISITGGTDNDMDEPAAAYFVIDNSSPGSPSPGGSIGSDASINVSAGSISDGGRVLRLDIFNGGGGMIGGNASITVAAGSISATGPGIAGAGENLNLFIDNSGGGSIGKDATVNIQTANISAAHNFVAQIVNFNGGTIGGKAALTLNATGSVNAGGLAFFGLFNNPGAIGSDASVDVSAASLTAGSFFEAFIENVGGTIGGNATVQVGIPGNLNAGHLFVVIDSSSGGSVGGNETINMNVSGTATVNNEATVQILGPDPTGSAAINFNGGTYQIGGTFFNAIGGNGTITFTNTDLHANVVKVGVFGANGSLIIGGSGTNTISADTLLHLYAPGSNGLLKFVASVTLSSGTAMDLAANTITINSGVTVTIAGNGGAANIFTNNANYAGFGGNGSTTGTFAGNGANNPQPLSNAPVFSATASSPSSSGTTSVSGNVTSSTKATGSTINVSDSGQLLSLLNSSTAGAGGKITVSNTTNRSRNSRATSPTERSRPSGGAKNVQGSAGVQPLPATVAALPRTQ